MTAAAMTPSQRRPRGRPQSDIDEDAVLDAALVELTRTEVPTSMQGIASRAGVPKTTLHDRYGGKEGLIERAVSRERRRLADHLVTSYLDARSETAPGAQIRSGYAALFGWAKAHPDSFRLLFGETPHSGVPQPETRAMVSRQITELLRERFAAAGLPLGVSGEIIAAVIVGAGESVARIIASGADVDLDQATDLVASLISNGLAGVDVASIRSIDRGRSD